MQKIRYQTDQNNPTIKAYREAVEKGMKNQHVLPYKGKWAVGNLGSVQVDRVFANPQEAIAYAESHAAHGTAVFVHGVDGRIQERKDY